VSQYRLSAWVHLFGTLVTVAAIVIEPPVVIATVVWTLVWTAVFAATLWAGPALAAGQRIARPPRLGHEGFAAIAVGFFILSEGVPLIWLVTWLLSSLSTWLVAGLVASGLAVFHCAWLPRQLIEAMRARRMVDDWRIDDLIAHIRSRPESRTPALTVMAADLLLDARQWDNAATLLGEFPPDAELQLPLRERWAVSAFRAHTMAGDLEGADQVLDRPEVPDTPAVRGARLWLAALDGRGQEVLDTLDGPDRPPGFDAGLEIILRAHALAALDRKDDAREVLERLGSALDDVIQPEGPATALAREMAEKGTSPSSSPES
jgi:hypothetical protein